MTDQTGDAPWWHAPGAAEGEPGAGEPGPSAGGDRTEGFGSAGASWVGADPAAQAAAVLGTVAQEAGKLIVALQERLASPGAGPAIATGSAECLVCPVCRAIAALRTVDPEAVERLTAAAAGLVATVRTSTADAESAAGPAPSGDGADQGTDDASEDPCLTGRSAGSSDAAADAGARPRRPRSTRPTRPRAPRVERIPLDDDDPGDQR